MCCPRHRKDKGTYLHWKQRYYNYTMTFRNQRDKNDTTFSTFLWELKKSPKEITNIKRSVLKVPE